MHNLKTCQRSSGSSMETDSLPGYDDLYPDGGVGSRRQNDILPDSDGGQQMENLKSAPAVTNDSLSSSLPSTSTTDTNTNTNKDVSMSNGTTTQLSEIKCDTSTENPDEKALKDPQLTRLAKNFGNGWEMFFIENGVDQSDIDIARADNPGQMTKQVYACLRVWRVNQAKTGKIPSAKVLRARLKKCDHLTFSFDKFDQSLAEG